MVDTAGKPLVLTTIWLVPADTTALSRGALTDTAGAFAFERLAAGRYFLRVDRVGYRSEWSDAKQVSPGQRLALAVTSAPAPIELGRITTPGPCRTGAQIAADTVLAALWGEARKAAAARRLFDLSYRYDVQVMEEIGAFGTQYYQRHARHRFTSTPALARVLAESGSWAGFGVAMDSTRLVAVQEMLQVLTDRFGDTHCLHAASDRRGRRRIHFQPLAYLAGVTDVAGNILLDDGYRLRRIEFEYRTGARSGYRGHVDFGDGGLKGSPVRFASKLVVWVFDGPVSRGENIEAGSLVPWGKKRAQAWAWYAGFHLDTASP